jgi:hypothetical protein
MLLILKRYPLITQAKRRFIVTFVIVTLKPNPNDKENFIYYW